MGPSDGSWHKHRRSPLCRRLRPNALRERQPIGGGIHHKTCVLCFLGLRGRAQSERATRFASSPRSRLGRDDRGFLDLTDNGELVLDREVGNQYTHGLASII